MGPFREGRVAWRPHDMPFKARQGKAMWAHQGDAKG